MEWASRYNQGGFFRRCHGGVVIGIHLIRYACAKADCVAILRGIFFTSIYGLSAFRNKIARIAINKKCLQSNVLQSRAGYNYNLFCGFCSGLGDSRKTTCKCFRPQKVEISALNFFMCVFWYIFDWIVYFPVSIGYLPMFGLYTLRSIPVWNRLRLQ